jgi:hypothetical protein
LDPLRELLSKILRTSNNNKIINSNKDQYFKIKKSRSKSICNLLDSLDKDQLDTIHFQEWQELTSSQDSFQNLHFSQALVLKWEQALSKDKIKDLEILIYQITDRMNRISWVQINSFHNSLDHSVSQVCLMMTHLFICKMSLYSIHIYLQQIIHRTLDQALISKMF